MWGPRHVRHVHRDVHSGRELPERKLACHGVAERAYVPRPHVLLPAPDQVGVQLLRAASELAREEAREHAHVASPQPERRELDARDREAIEEIVAEATGLHLA